MTNETMGKRERKADPDSVRIRDVKQAVAKRNAAQAALAKANDRLKKSQAELVTLIDGAPKELQAYLRAIAGLPAA